MITASVHYDDVTQMVVPGDVFTFGRGDTCNLVIGPSDHGISRRAGSIVFEGSCWWVVNESRKRTFEIINNRTRQASPVAVVSDSGHQDRRAILDPVTIVVTGEVRRHAIELTPATDSTAEWEAIVVPSGSADTTDLVRLTPRQLEAAIALAWWYLQPFPRYRDEPATYTEVAERIGCVPKRAEKLITQVRERLVAAGYSGLVDVRDARAGVCNAALTLRLIGPDSIAWLEARTGARSTTHPAG